MKSSLNRKEMKAEGLQKGKKRYKIMSKYNKQEYYTMHEFHKSYLLVEAKFITPSVMFNVTKRKH